MTRRQYKVGRCRQQALLLPPSIDEYVAENNPVRAIDAYVETLDLPRLGFQNTGPGGQAGQPPFPPGALLKLYLYGYLNRVHSSRRLECETVRNLEVIWLLEDLRPGYKTIANFRKDNSAVLKAVNQDFILLCKQLGLFGGEQVAVDGSFFKGDASCDGIFTAKKLDTQLDALAKKIDSYQQALAGQDAADDRAGLGSLVADGALSEKIARLKVKQAAKKALREQLEKSDDSQVSTVDPDARLLSKHGKVTAGYNVQIAVNGKHKLIVASDVSQDGNDTQQLVPMLEKAQEVLQAEHLTGLADVGYFSGEQVKLAEEKSFEIVVPVPNKGEAAAKEGRFPRSQFHYNAETDRYRCPQGETLAPCGSLQERDGRRIQAYKSKVSVCNSCPLRSQCLGEKSRYKKIERWEHEAVVERHKQRMENVGPIMKTRSQWVEHPFGTLKHRAGMHHFLMRGLEKCRGEFSLMVLCYNFTRVLNILGIDKFRDYCIRRYENGANGFG
ncbi:MAG: IS1182 family transposase [Methylosarcina sp.]